MQQSDIYSDIYKHSSANLNRYISGWKTSAYIPMPSEWAHENRYLPAGTTEFPGKIDHAIAPHMVEIQDCFHPDSGISQVSIMKSTQSLATTTLENVIGHSIKYKLHNILYIISSKNIAGIRSSAAIDVMIDNSGLAEYVKPISQRMKRKIADNKFYKEFDGGRRLMMTSWNSIGDAKSLTWSLIIMDEIDEAPYELKGQGDPESIFAGRGKTIRNLKIAKISTPTTTHGRIYTNFLNGDQRFFYCQCPFCGELQVLELGGMGKKYGLKAQSETVDGILQILPETVGYICKFCEKEIKEYLKGKMLLGGKWKPTARPVNPSYRSYHISNLMSPVMFYSWTRVMQEFAETDWGNNVTKFKNFSIDVLGWPWENRSAKTNWKDLKSKAEYYELRTVPLGGLIILGGVDVQEDRTELQVVAYGVENGAGMASWVIDYQIFWGDTKNLNSKAWVDLRNYIISKKYKVTQLNKKNEKEFPIAMTAIDSGYNPKAFGRGESEVNLTIEHVVYEFVARTPKTIACRGNPDLTDMILKQERVKRKSFLKIRYDHAVSEVKDLVFSMIMQEKTTPGYIHFTRQLDDEYFKGFVSEVFAEVKPGKWEWKKIYERNEPLDTYILTRAAAERLNLPTWTLDVWMNYDRQLFS